MVDKDRIAGSIKVIAGRTKEALGKLAGDRKLQTTGAAEQAVGKVQNAVGGAKDTMRESIKK